MDRLISELREAAELYTLEKDYYIGKLLGKGEDAYVWKSSEDTAVKSFYRAKNYWNERDCYLRLSDLEITELSGFVVPQLIGYSDELLIVEMGLVTPPRVLDFGKAYLDRPADYPEQALIDSMNAFRENYSSDDWERVLEVVDDLASIQIYYYDLKPGNIQVRGAD
jgi:hypothetical protein